MKKRRMFNTLLAFAMIAMSVFTIASCDNKVAVERLAYDANGDLLVYFTDGSTQTLQAPSVSAQNTETLHFQKIIGKDEYRVIGLGTVSDNEVVIPATYRGLPVTEISAYGLRCERGEVVAIEITKIVIPDSVTTIGDYAFKENYKLTEIVIPDSVTTIGEWVFTGCSNLTIYCEVDSKPDGWDNSWNASCSVVWGYKGE